MVGEPQSGVQLALLDLGQAPHPFHLVGSPQGDEPSTEGGSGTRKSDPDHTLGLESLVSTDGNFDADSKESPIHEGEQMVLGRRLNGFRTGQDRVAVLLRWSRSRDDLQRLPLRLVVGSRQEHYRAPLVNVRPPHLAALHPPPFPASERRRGRYRSERRPLEETRQSAERTTVPHEDHGGGVRRGGGAGASAPLVVIAHVLRFVLHLGLLSASWPWWKTVGTVAGSSLFQEVIQYVLALGSSDVIDVIVNTAGALAGRGLIILARCRLQERTAIVRPRICSIGTVGAPALECCSS